MAVNNQGAFESIKDLRSMAVLYENKRENFLCKHCNIMYKGLGVEGYVETSRRSSGAASRRIRHGGRGAVSMWGWTWPRRMIIPPFPW